MEVVNKATSFLANYKNDRDFFERYFAQNDFIFPFYFQQHCARKEEKIEQALKTYPHLIDQMEEINIKLEKTTNEFIARYERHFNIELTESAYIFVGLYGSMAYTDHAIKPSIYFCVNRITNDDLSIQAIVAHELGHAIHRQYAFTHAPIPPKDIWSNPWVWLLSEGLATYLSMQFVKAPLDYYYAFHENKAWVKFVTTNEKQIYKAYLRDSETLSSGALFKEWFSINGGEKFGHVAIAYYIGTKIVEQLLESKSLEEVFCLWQEENFIEQIKQAFFKQLKN